MRTTLLVVVIGSLARRGATQDIAGWTNILNCTNDFGGVGTTVYDFHEGYDIAAMAEEATRVKLCTMGSTTDCVTSTVGSYPVVNLRNGERLISHVDARIPCNMNCVRSSWTGEESRLTALRSNCLSIDPEITFWQGCGNVDGIKWLPSQGGRGALCTWFLHDTTEDPGIPGLNLYLDMTPSPTAAPTTAPTQWFEHPGHEENITELQATVVALTSTVRALEARLGDLSHDTVHRSLNALGSRVDDAELAASALEDLVEESAANHTGSMTTIAALQTSSDALRATLRAAVASVSDGSRPLQAMVEAVGGGIWIEAPDNVAVRTGSCVADGLCEAAAFAARLQQALRQDL